jgi:redox-sensitive bicupin YhaK (pirin superfamily)
MTQADVRVVHAADREHWRSDWLESRQSFLATGNFDLAAGAHGMLMVHNDDVVDAGEGFDTHQHHSVEIVTWVLEGTLVHQDSLGHSGLIYPGLAQRMSAGSRIMHSEKNGALRRDGTPLRVVQMWLPPDNAGGQSSYQELDVATDLRDGSLVTIASGMKRDRNTTAIGIGNSHAALHVARLQPGQSVTIPDAPYGHVFVAIGDVAFEDIGDLGQGDAVRMTATGGHRVTARTATELLIWEMNRGFETQQNAAAP